MQPLHLLLSAGVYFLLSASSATAQCNTNQLTNPDFETPVQPAFGNNLTGAFTFNGWSMTGGPFNVIRTNGTAYPGGPDNAKSGTQYVDITSAGGTITQDFSIASANTSVAFGGHFSSREAAGYTPWTASITIVSLPSLAVMATSNTRAFTATDGAIPAQEAWYYLFGNTTLNAGNYRFVVNLGDNGNFDAPFVYVNCVLPISLELFSGSYQTNRVQLTWKTGEQSNFSHFELEKSTDPAGFTAVSKIAPNPSGAYSFSDPSVTPGTLYYYRLKMVDLDGKSLYSNILKIATKGVSGLMLLNNPVLSELNIAGLKNSGVLRVLDMSGKVVLNRNVQAQSLSISVAQLKNGVYLLQYINGKNIETEKFVKQ